MNNFFIIEKRKEKEEKTHRRPKRVRTNSQWIEAIGKSLRTAFVNGRHTSMEEIAHEIGATKQGAEYRITTLGLRPYLEISFRGITYKDKDAARALKKMGFDVPPQALWDQEDIEELLSMFEVYNIDIDEGIRLIRETFRDVYR